MIYRCPVDDCVFTARKLSDSVPTVNGHPECPGPVCSEKFANFDFVAATKAPSRPAATVASTTAAIAPGASGPALPSQGW